MSEQRMRIFLFAGGTGGHIYPALATALKLLDLDCVVDWYGAKKGKEEEVSAQNNVDFKRLPLAGYYGKGYVQKALAIIFFIISTLIVFWNCLITRPKAMVCFGGFTSIPAILPSVILRIPLLIHEQNASISSANKLASRVSDHKYIGMPSQSPGWKYIGNPLRYKAEVAKVKPRIKRNQAANIGFMGGSQGASALNKLAETCIKNSPVDWNWKIIAGLGKTQDIDKSIANLSNVSIQEYCNDMPAFYCGADIVVCRAGAMTISELCLFGTPSILIPLPGSINNHQALNADLMKQSGVCEVIDQAEAETQKLQGVLTSLIEDDEKLIAMQQAACLLGKPHATENFVSAIIKVARS